MPSLGSHRCSTANKQPKAGTLTSVRQARPTPTPAGAYLVQCSQAILIGQVGADPTTKELADCKKRKEGRVLKTYQVPLFLQAPGVISIGHRGGKRACYS